MDRFEFFSKLPRSEPGGTSFTSSYLGAVHLRSTDRVLDLRCGNGDRSAWVARSRCCQIIAVDQDARYLPLLKKTAEECGSGNQITGLVARYDALPFPDESFHLVLAEWAAMRSGLQRSVHAWRRLVPIGGHVALAHPGVVNRDAPPEVRLPLERRMVESLLTLSDYQVVLRGAGYEIVHQAPLLHDLWERFYSDSIRRAWALIRSGEVDENDPTIESVLNEAHWYRRVGRGRVFLQAMLLKRVR